MDQSASFEEQEQVEDEEKEQVGVGLEPPHQSDPISDRYQVALIGAVALAGQLPRFRQLA